MSYVLTLYDETLSGERSSGIRLDLISATITLRELLRCRVYEEVQEYNLSTPEVFRGLVQPTNTERVLNGYKVREPRRIDWEQQYSRAVEAFERNGFFVLVNDHQIETLDEPLELKIDTQVSFVKLVALVGG